MKKLMLFGAALVVHAAAASYQLSADEGQRKPPPPQYPTACYQLSANEGSFSRTPEMLCVTMGMGETAKDAEITLAINEVGNLKKIGIFHLDLLSRVRCFDCNKDVYGVSNPSNSVFNKLKIEFDGKKDLSKGDEEGTVKIGETMFHYRKPLGIIHPNKDFPSQCNCPAYTHPVPLGPQNCTCEPD
ncbi:MAG: hypothetical protein PHP45_03180 [Elusimicrobiales bacterium]|nr:hypothetical protein [Elusimicrobiales bacterium]